MDTDKRGFNRRKERERRGEGKIMRGKIMGGKDGKKLFSGLC
jgi:hypothetical protein